ncbi:PASTA domain-containing protein [Blastococcus deserti]|uniref:PASTA domain-containing protein n=1 Tax=Blastococcus deserti TaxID=2259033 RepID=A0ABW4XD42_9ACTN
MGSAIVHQILAAEEAPGSATFLQGADRIWLLGLAVAFLLAAGYVITRGRQSLQSRRGLESGSASPGEGKSGTSRTNRRRARTRQSEAGEEDKTLVRSWIAISLVGGLVIFMAASFWIDDPTLRSALVGGFVANTGAAVAFYFASKSSEEARRDILTASTAASTTVPDLKGMYAENVYRLMAASVLRLETDRPTPHPRAQVVDQRPGAGTSAVPQTMVFVTFAGPVPDLHDMTSRDAQTSLARANLEFDPDPDNPGAEMRVVDQHPKADDPVPSDRKVTVTFALPSKNGPQT